MLQDTLSAGLGCIFLMNAVTTTISEEAPFLKCILPCRLFSEMKAVKIFLSEKLKKYIV